MPIISTVDQSLNTTHISGQQYQYYEAARSAFFVLTIPETELENLLKVDYTGDPAAAKAADMLTAKTAAQSLRLNVVKSSVPTFSIQTAEYRRGNDTVKFATVPTWTEGSLVIDDIVGLDTKEILNSWLYLAYNPNNRMGGRMKDYKKHCVLTEYTQDYEPVRNWQLEGCFITELTEAEFDRENDSKRQITVKLSYDRATMDFDGVDKSKLI